MDLNLVRLCIPLPPESERRLSKAFVSDRAGIERSLAPLCSRALSSDPDLVRRHQKPGLPFVFSQPSHNGVDCLLLGPAIAELPLMLATVAQWSSAGTITAFYAYDYQGQAAVLPADGGDQLPILSLAHLLDMASARYAACRRLRITLQTPLRMVIDGREATRFDGVRFVRSMIRRVSSLAAYYGTAGDPDYFIRLADRAGDLTVCDATIVRPMPGQRGLLGSFTVTGPWDELGPLLEVGGLLHLGKAASFGFGAFGVTPLS